MYFFIRLYEYSEQEWDKRKLIAEDVFESEDREKAKKYCIDTYGKYPFRLTTKVDGCKYFYLTESSLYWYEWHHKKIKVECDYCHKIVEIPIKRRFYNKFGEYCSLECKESHYNELVNTIDNEDLWINEDEHLGIPKDNDFDIVGYIYKITNKNTLKCYVGKTIKPPIFRWWQHLKVDGKFERANISDLVFECLEIVTYDEKIEKEKYHCGADKLSARESFYIHSFDCLENGYNARDEIKFDEDSQINLFKGEKNL